MPDSFFNRFKGWWPIRLPGQKTPTRIEPEIYTQAGGGLTFGASGITKSVGGKFGEISGDNQFVIDRPGASQLVETQAAMENFKGLVYAAINAVAREVMNIDLRLFQVNGKDHKELDGHALLELLDTVNDSMTAAELKYYISSHLYLAGSSYLFLEGVKNVTDQPSALYPMIPSQVQVLIDKTTWPYKLKGFKMKPDGAVKPINFDPSQVIHIRNPNPLDFFNGYSPVGAAAEYIDNDDYLWDYNRRFFQNGARPSGVLETDAVAETQIENIKIGFTNAHVGIENMQRIAVLPKGVKWAATGAAPKDMDFKNLSDDTKERILLIFGVSRTILGTAESDTNRATAETADYVFSKRVVKPHMDLICSFLNRFLTSRYGDNLYLSYIDPVPEDRAARTTEMQAMVGGTAILTPNEARDEYAGMGPVDGGDSLYIPSTMSPAGQPKPAGDVDPEATGETPSKQIKAANGQRVSFRPARSNFKTQATKGKQIADALAAKITSALEDIKENPTVKLKTEDHDIAWHQIVGRVTSSEKEIIRTLQDINASQRQEVLANLAAQQKSIDAKKLLDVPAWTALTASALLPILVSLYASEGRRGAEEVGKPELDPMSDASALHQLTLSTQQAAESYNTTTQELLQAKINEGLSQGMTVDQLTEVVQNIYDFTDTSRAAMLAKTEAFRTANQALKSAWVQSGNVKSLEWYTADNPCEFCQAMQGKVVSINENFLSKGDKLTANVTLQDGSISTRTMNIDYADVEFPPLHPMCRCVCRPSEITL